LPFAISHQPSAMTRITIAFVVLLSLAAGAQSQTGDPMLARIRVEGLEHSQVAPVFDMLTVSIGPRLTASPAHKRAAEWTRDRLASYGLANAHLEPWKFGRGWTLEKLTIELVEPRYLPLLGYADAWSRSTAGDIAGAPVLVAGKSPEEIAALGSTIAFNILLYAIGFFFGPRMFVHGNLKDDKWIGLIIPAMACSMIFLGIAVYFAMVAGSFRYQLFFILLGIASFWWLDAPWYSIQVVEPFSLSGRRRTCGQTMNQKPATAATT
jgi:hypothetical protein